MGWYVEAGDVVRGPFIEVTFEDGEMRYPGWCGHDGLVHIVGLHTTTSIRTECDQYIVRSGRLDHQIEQYDPCYDPPTCLECIANWEPIDVSR